MSERAPEPPPRSPRPPPRMSYRRVTPPVYRDSFNVERSDSSGSVKSPSRSRTNTERNDVLSEFLDRLRVAPRRDEDAKAIRKEELGTIIHDENVMSGLIASLSGAFMTDDSVDVFASDNEIELMDEKGLMNNVHVAARWLMSNASPQCAFYHRRTQKRIAALCLAMRRAEEKSDKTKIVASKNEAKKKEILSSENVLRELRIVSLKGLAPVCSVLLSTIRDQDDASRYAKTMNVLRRSLNEHTAASLKEVLGVPEIPSQTEELLSISNYIVQQMGLEDFSSSKDIPFQVSPDVVSHVKSTIVQRACVETLIALGTSRRSLRDVLASIVSLIRQPLDTKEKQFDVELSVSLNCMRDMLQKFRSRKQASSSSPLPSSQESNKTPRRVSIVQGITVTPRHRNNEPPSFFAATRTSVNSYTEKSSSNYESSMTRLHAAAALMACLDRFSEPYDHKRASVVSSSDDEKEKVVVPLSVDLSVPVFRMLFTLLLSNVSSLATEKEDTKHAKYLILGTLRVLKVGVCAREHHLHHSHSHTHTGTLSSIRIVQRSRRRRTPTSTYRCRSIRQRVVSCSQLHSCDCK